MATTVVSICNLSLARVGHDRAIQALAPDENSKAANLCAMFYEPMRDKVLRDFAWPFAKKYAALNLVEENPNTDWLYAYRWPSDCLRALRIVNAAGRTAGLTAPIPYTIGHDAAGKLIYTDEPNAVLLHTARYTDPTWFDADFVSALAWRIAQELAAPMARGDFPAMRERAMKEYAAEISNAEANAANEVQADPNPDAEWIRARQ